VRIAHPLRFATIDSVATRVPALEILLLKADEIYPHLCQVGQTVPVKPIRMSAAE